MPDEDRQRDAPASVVLVEDGGPVVGVRWERLGGDEATMTAVAMTGQLHHLELWTDSAGRGGGAWPWLLARLGYALESSWSSGSSWRLGVSYLVLESGADHERGRAERSRSGMNHVAFWAGSRNEVDALTAEACAQGWTLLFGEEHPHAGGPDHYAAYLECGDGLEVELVAAG